MSKFIAIIQVFLVGGFGALGVEGMMDPVLATSLATVLAAALTEVARRMRAPSDSLKGPAAGGLVMLVALVLGGCAAVKPIAVSAEQMLCAQYRSGERFITPEQALQLGCTVSAAIPWKAEAERALRSGARSLPAGE